MLSGSPSMLPLNPFDPRARPDPYPVYQYMRTVEPVHRSPLGFWILTRYDDCRSVLEDTRWSHDADRIFEPGRKANQAVDPIVRLLRASVAFADGPAHTSTSRRLEAALKKSTRELGPRVEKVARDLLTLMREKDGGVDMVRDFAGLLPLVVLCDVVGIPASDRAQVQRWGLQLAAGLDPAIRARGVASADSAAMAIVEYLLDRLDAASAGGEGLIAELRPSNASTRTWALAADLVTVLIMGIETTRGLIGNGVLALLRRPDQLEMLRHEPERLPAAIEEFVRFDGPVHLTARVANEQVTVAGSTMQAGEQALLMLGAANRDPSRFTDPDRLDISRSENAHLGFGAGSHSCFAAPLARVMARAAFGVLLSAATDVVLDGDPEWHDTVTFRSLSKLPVRLQA